MAELNSALPPILEIDVRVGLFNIHLNRLNEANVSRLKPRYATMGASNFQNTYVCMNINWNCCERHDRDFSALVKCTEIFPDEDQLFRT